MRLKISDRHLEYWQFYRPIYKKTQNVGQVFKIFSTPTVFTPLIGLPCYSHPNLFAPVYQSTLAIKMACKIDICSRTAFLNILQRVIPRRLKSWQYFTNLKPRTNLQTFVIRFIGAISEVSCFMTTCSMIQKFVFLLLEWSQQFVVEIYFVKICLIIGRIETKRRIDIIYDDGVKTSYL